MSNDTSNDDYVAFVYESDWGSIALVPAENLTAALEAVRARAFAPPESPVPVLPHPLLQRNLSVDNVHAAFSDVLRWSNGLRTGLTSAPWYVRGGFAMIEEDFGTVYGTANAESVVEALYFDNTYCDCGIDFSRAMRALADFAAQHDLILVDWLLDAVFDIRHPETVIRYFEDT